jgi:hypothetical protein
MPELARFVRVDEAAQRTGMTPRAIDRRIGAGEISSFRDPRDRRHRLVAIEDLDQLMDVVPFGQDQAPAERQAVKQRTTRGATNQSEPFRGFFT